MSDHPSTIHVADAARGFGWNDPAELHKSEDESGVFHRLRAIRRGTMAELVRFVMEMPQDRQGDFAIHKDGDHLFPIGEIRALFRRKDFPG